VSIEKKSFVIRSKIWIEDEHGDVVFGHGRYRILEAIERFGSLQGAAKDLKMSYRALWGRVKASEERLGQSLVTREGRGSRLTPFALQLMARYRELQNRIHHESEVVYSNLISNHLDTIQNK